MGMWRKLLDGRWLLGLQESEDGKTELYTPSTKLPDTYARALPTTSTSRVLIILASVSQTLWLDDFSFLTF